MQGLSGPAGRLSVASPNESLSRKAEPREWFAVCPGAKPVPLTISLLSKHEAKMSQLQELNDEDFQTTIENSDVPVLIDFSATWCQPCKALAPTIEAVASEYGERLLVRKVDIDQAPDTATRFGIQGVPTCIFFKSGNEADRFIGIKDIKEIRGMVDRVLADG